MTGRMIELIEAMELERTRRQLDHTGFSTLLGIQLSDWTRMRTGEREPSKTTLMLIIRNLPEVEPQVIAYMKDGGRSRRAIEKPTMRQGNDGLDGEMPEKQHANSGASEENHTPHPKLARKPSKSAQCR